MKLTGENGNVFNIIGIVSKALRLNDQKEENVEFVKKALSVIIIMRYYHL